MATRRITRGNRSGCFKVALSSPVHDRWGITGSIVILLPQEAEPWLFRRCSTQPGGAQLSDDAKHVATPMILSMSCENPFSSIGPQTQTLFMRKGKQAITPPDHAVDIRGQPPIPLRLEEEIDARNPVIDEGNTRGNSDQDSVRRVVVVIPVRHPAEDNGASPLYRMLPLIGNGALPARITLPAMTK